MANTYAITIAGAAKAIQVGWSITESVNGRSTLDCDVLSARSTYRPAIGAEVIVTENGTRIFGGYINTPNEAGFSTGITTHVSAVDYNVLADRRFVQDGGFPVGYTLKQALTSLVGYLTDYGVTLHASQVNGPTLPLLVYDVRSITSILDELSVITGYTWKIDYDKKLRMTDVGELTAPFTLTTASHAAEGGDVTVVKEREGYANRVIVKAGTGTSEVTDTFTGNGTATTFPLTYRLYANRGYITNGAANEPIGVTTPPYWLYATSTNQIVRSSAPANLSAISITYIASFPYVATADAGAAPADLVERVYIAPDVFSAIVAQALAAGYLARALDVSKTVQYSTRRLGLHAGQTQTITIPERELSGTFLITDVVTNNPSGGIVTHTVTATGGSEYHGSFRDTLRQLGSGSASSTVSGTLQMGGAATASGAGTIGRLARWVTAGTIGDALLSDDATSRILFQAASPNFHFYDTGGIADKRRMAFSMANSAVQLRAYTDNAAVSTLQWEALRLAAGDCQFTVSGTAIVDALTVGGYLTVGLSARFGDVPQPDYPGIALDGATLPPTVTANTLYNQSGVLMWAGGAIASIGTGTAGKLAKFTSTSALGNSIATESGTTITVAGTVAATTFSGSGASLTSLPAGQLTGTIPAATLTGRSLADLGTRSASDLSSGNLPWAQLSTGSGTWTATPTITGIATFSSAVVASANIGTVDYVSQTTGWRITAAGAADVRSLYTDEMTAKSFVADLEQALAGGQIITKSVAVLAASFTAPAASGVTSLVVEDLPSAPNMAVFVSGDTVVLRTFARSGGALTVSECVGVVTAYVDN